MLVVPIRVEDIDIAKDFYCGKLLFKITKNSPKIVKNQFFIEGITENIELCIIKSSFLRKNDILRRRESWLSFEKIDVGSLYLRIRKLVPEFDGPREELPNGYSSGLLDCPGGLYMTIYDPFGNRLEFCE